MTSTPARFLRLNSADNVIVAIDPIFPGQAISGVAAESRIPKGHKMAIVPIGIGNPILKFGQIIGFASQNIATGEWVHTNNCAFAAVPHEYAFAEESKKNSALDDPGPATFQGYIRSNGSVGTRNYIGLLTSVNCSATVARHIARAIERSDLLADYPNVDGVIPLVHGAGCAMDIQGEGNEILKRTQWGYASNPNMGGVVMVGLGCETFQIGRFMEHYQLQESDTFRTFTIQDIGGTQKTIAAGVEAVAAMLPTVNAAVRETVLAAKLTVGLQCGGSDGYSGITANPALGAAVDLLVQHGGTAILSETPEIYGAEHLLTRRAKDRAVGEKLLKIIRWWEDYTARNHGTMDNNPSPGNKAGGLTTILEKSLGAVAKGGTTPLNAVYHYAERVDTSGLVFMDTPGYDPVSATGQVAGGANVIAFTTGRGSAYGCKPTPSLKLSTNSEIYRRMPDDMDMDCGDILDGVSVEEKGRQIFQKILSVASGERTKSEALGYGDAEFVPWQVGAVM